ncbi:heavy-metal-associated domain-containing protein [uncultured Ornithinimicrobium sp.]|uniref:heavy-metal-associated domain-containing protein n=1 Tax=uncultured Ornithinimicrobium sp. TaxID=259307 RepID=UPI002591A3D1|nr:heavy-metal-associated domain-containing protein [uncultured Ornithinimicrobium sp.]
MCGTDTTTQTAEQTSAEEKPSCACCSTQAENGAATSDADTSPVQTTYLVTGMTCGHCATAVTNELEALEDVSSVQVDVVSGGESSVHVASAKELSAEQVRAALAEAGDYALSGTR